MSTLPYKHNTAVIQVALAEVMYSVTEGPMAQVTVCVNIELGTVRSDTTVALVTTFGGTSTGKPYFEVPFSDNGMDFREISYVRNFNDKRVTVNVYSITEDMTLIV